MSKHAYLYSVPRYRGDRRYSVYSTYGLKNASSIAEEAADDFHENRDGEGARWPLELDLYTDDDKFLGRFKVDREYRLEFSAKKVDVPAPAGHK